MILEVSAVVKFQVVIFWVVDMV